MLRTIARTIPPGLLAALFAAFLSGCAGTPISQQQLAKVYFIEIDPNVPVVNDPYVSGAGAQGAAIIGGGIGAAIEATSTGKDFARFLADNKISVGNIVLEEFSKRIPMETTFRVGAPEGGSPDATLKLTINTYGFGTTGSITSMDKRKPMINVTAALLGRDGGTLWESREYITNLSDLTTEVSVNTILSEPQVAAKSLREAAGIVASLLFAELREG